MGGIAVGVLAAGCGADDTATDGATLEAPPPEGPVPMIVDYSPTLSDVPALLFLATHPDVDLLAVTLPGTGESDCEPGVRNTRALLSIAGHPDVPVACGPEAPMTGERDWPLQFREAANNLEGVVLPAVTDSDPTDAVELLANTLRGADHPVTIVTLGPLTNLGYAFQAEPTLADNVGSIVTMGGAFDVAGNVFDAGEIAGASPDAEWNLYIDPESVDVVLNSGAAITFVPLDATNFVPGNMSIFSRLSATSTTDSGEAVRQLWAASLGTERSIAAEWWYFWDELAAVIAVDPAVATISERKVAIDDLGVTTQHENGVPALVASAADPDAFEQRFLETFAGGELPPIQLTNEEEQYLTAVRAATHDLVTAVDGAFIEAETQADQVPADELAAQITGQVFSAMHTFHQRLSAATSPTSIQPQHDALLDAAATFAAQEDIYLDTLATAAPQEPIGVNDFFAIFFGAMEAAELTSPFDAFETACADLELAAYGLGATEAICLTDGPS